MTEPLGLSIGTTNLVAARVGRPPVIRRSILHLFDDRAPEVGAPDQVAGPSVVLRGFVDRVGDPVPLVAADGSSHRGDQALAAALDAMARTVDGGSPVAVAVPAHWGPGAVGALRGALRNHPSLSPDGVPATLVPDAVAALAALRVTQPVPERGVVALVDLGGSGTSITLADAGANLAPIGQTVRFADFSGDGIDQALLDHVLEGLSDGEGADTAGTAAVGPLTRLRDECRKAKEQLSSETAAVVTAQLPGVSTDVRVTRPELEQLVAGPLDALLNAIDDTVQRNGVAAGGVTAVATVGGGAAVPLVTQKLSERLRAPVLTSPEPALNVAAGAALVANQSLDSDATGLAPAADAPTAMGHAAWAAGAAGLAATESAADGAGSATFRALAWSQDDDAAGDPLPYTGEDYTSPAAYDQGMTAARPPVGFGDPADGEAELPPLPWYKRPPVLFGVAAAALLLAVGGLVYTLTGSNTGLIPGTGPSTEPAEMITPPPVTTVTIGPDGQATTTVSQPPPEPAPTSSTDTTASSETSTTSSTSETSTTTTSPTTTTTTTTQPTTTTTRTTTTRPTTTQPTTTAPPTTTAEQPTSEEPAGPVTTTVVAPDIGG